MIINPSKMIQDDSCGGPKIEGITIPDVLVYPRWHCMLSRILSRTNLLCIILFRNAYFQVNVHKTAALLTACKTASCILFHCF